MPWFVPCAFSVLGGGFFLPQFIFSEFRTLDSKIQAPARPPCFAHHLLGGILFSVCAVLGPVC